MEGFLCRYFREPFTYFDEGFFLRFFLMLMIFPIICPEVTFNFFLSENEKANKVIVLDILYILFYTS